MTRKTKIGLYSILLLASIFFKYSDFSSFEFQKPNIQNSEPRTTKPYNPKKTNSLRNTELEKKLKELEDIKNSFDPNKFKPIKPLDIGLANPDYTISHPNNGYSPYDNIYGKGVYHQTNNTAKVTAPLQRDIVFLLKDLSTGRFIRNEFIRRGSTFSLTQIPYGSYKFYYTYGTEWSEQAPFKDYKNAGNFTKGYAISKSDEWKDVEFENGYSSTYTLVLQLVTNGNLETEAASEDEI